MHKEPTPTSSAPQALCWGAGRTLQITSGRPVQLEFPSLAVVPPPLWLVWKLEALKSENEVPTLSSRRMVISSTVKPEGRGGEDDISNATGS